MRPQEVAYVSSYTFNADCERQFYASPSLEGKRLQAAVGKILSHSAFEVRSFEKSNTKSLSSQEGGRKLQAAIHKMSVKNTVQVMTLSDNIKETLTNFGGAAGQSFSMGQEEFAPFMKFCMAWAIKCAADGGRV